MFWLHENGRLMISTARKDIQAPLLNLPIETRYSLTRTSGYHESEICQHEFVLSHTRQIRSGDETESGIYKCTKCNKVDIKH